MPEADRPERGLDIAELIERGTLGTPEALALRTSTPLWVRYELLARVLKPEDQRDEERLKSHVIVVVVRPWTRTRARLRRLWRRTT